MVGKKLGSIGEWNLLSIADMLPFGVPGIAGSTNATRRITTDTKI
jgi:hypothetical protein